jgi:hypothetical protein
MHIRWVALTLSLLCLSSSLVAQGEDENEPTPDEIKAPSEIYTISPRNGFVEGGTRIRISGKNLFPKMNIRLGGSPCTNVKLVAPNVLECVIPSHPPGTVGLMIQKPEFFLRKPKVFTYVPDVLVSPANLLVACGDKASFSVSGGYPPYTFSIVQGSGQLDSKTGELSAPQTHDLGVVRVTDSRGYMSEASYRALPKLKATPETADIETDLYLNVTPWGGEPPYRMDLITGGGKFFPDRRLYVSPATADKAVIHVTDSIGSEFDVLINVHRPPPLPGKLVAAGDEDTCAAPAGSVSCWGANRLQKKQTSKVIVTDRAEPVPQLDKNVTSIVSGAHHKCALVGDQVYCWGSNQFGQLGNGTTRSASVPTPVFGLESGVLAITAGSFHTCAALDHSIACWGQNENGQLGDGTTAVSLIPVPVSELKGKIMGISGGASHTCAIVDGVDWCWGKNENGQLGTGDKVDSSVPLKVKGLSGDVRLVSTGRASSCASGPGYLKCWGFNGIGNQDSKSNETSLPYSVQIPGDVSVLSSQQYHSCAIVSGAV